MSEEAVQAVRAQGEPLSEEAVQAVRAQCEQWLREALELRKVQVPGASASPADVHSCLVRARAHLDRLESVLSLASGLKAAAGIRARELEDAAEDGWDDQAEKERTGRRREYEGVQERYAWWRVATRQERLASRTARQVADVASDVESRVRLAYRGLDGLRADLNARLRYLQWEGVMER